MNKLLELKHQQNIKAFKSSEDLVKELQEMIEESENPLSAEEENKQEICCTFQYFKDNNKKLGFRLNEESDIESSFVASHLLLDTTYHITDANDFALEFNNQGLLAEGLVWDWDDLLDDNDICFITLVDIDLNDELV